MTSSNDHFEILIAPGFHHLVNRGLKQMPMSFECSLIDWEVRKTIPVIKKKEQLSQALQSGVCGDCLVFVTSGLPGMFFRSFCLAFLLVSSFS